MILKKSVFLVFIVSISLLAGFTFAGAQEKPELYFFYSQTCSHCAQESSFLDSLEQNYPQVKVRRFEVIYSAENQKLLKEFYEEYKVPETLRGLVPATFTPQKYFIGFNEEISKELESCLEECMRPGEREASLIDTSLIERNIKIPFFGEMKLSSFSFPAMAVILGLLDGFNVCSLGALILILSLVLSLRSRKKTFILGGVFLLTTALVYGVLIIFWYKFFEIISSYLKAMEVLIGILGVAGGTYFLKQFIDLRKKGPVCDSGAGSSIASKFSEKLKKLLENPSSSNALIAIGVVFAFALIITVVEFPCSAVVPVAFAAVLAQAGLTGLQYILYISIFVVFYLLDEIIIFLAALLTSKVWMSSPKFVKWIVLAEAAVLFFLGFYYLFGII